MKKNPNTLEPAPLVPERSRYTLVENRVSYTLEDCELNIYETHERAEDINMVFSDFVFTSMMRGKKVMHLFGNPGFDYLPGESVIVPPNEQIRIDFPEAQENNPTQCMALAISAAFIQKIVDELNESSPRFDAGDNWSLNPELFHLNNTSELRDITDRFVRIAVEDNSREKPVLADLALKELIVRLMQTQARALFNTNFLQLAASNRFAHVIKFIKENIREPLHPDILSDQACMSRASFFRKFRETFGLSPGDYILKERIKKAKEYLANPANHVTQVCFMAGFQNLNYFIRAFKKETGVTPKVYQQWVLQHEP